MRKIYCLGALAFGLATASCSCSNDEPVPSPEVGKLLSIKFVYDYNMDWVDALASNAPSANVWAFSRNGELAWSGAASAADFKKAGFCFNAELPEGDYDLVAWCGLDGNDAVKLTSYQPKSKEELSLAIKTHDANGLHVSDQYIPDFFHTSISEVRVKVGEAPDNTVTMSLIKDTKTISVRLHHIDGSPVDMADFSVSITDDNGMYAWNNSIVESPSVTYRPWMADNNEFKLSTGRLTVGSSPRLAVTHKFDERVIIDIPLLDYIFIYKSTCYPSLSNQEFLDREDSYSFGFILDENDNWLSNALISINDFTFRLGNSDL